MLIPDDKIEEIREAADIVDVVSEYVTLKKSGSGFKGLCPFHNEKTPSFHVNPTMNIYKCFGCSEGGDAFDFVQKMENVGFLESAQLIAGRVGIVIEVDEKEQERRSERESVYHALRFAARFFYKQLTQPKTGSKRPLNYLTDRGITPQTVKTFGLGYAPKGWENLLAEAKQQHLDAELLERAGLVIPSKNGDGYYDRFRHRIIFPLFSPVGKVVGFAGRVLEEQKDQPKYINSPETEVYHKGKVLYGLYQAKHEIRRQEEVLLVEGYTDVIALQQAGVKHAVATSGTALTEDQIKLLGRYAKRVILLYDADEAGARAAVRAVNLVLENGLVPNVVPLPEGSDPDGFVQEQGGEAFRTYLKNERKDFVEYQKELAQRKGRLEDPEGETEVMRSILRSIARMPDELRQEAYLKKAARTLDVPETTLYRELEKERAKAQKRAKRKRSSARKKPSAPQPSPPRNHSSRRAPQPPKRSRSVQKQKTAAIIPAEKLLLRLMLERGMPMVTFILSHMAVQEFTEGPARTMVENLLEMYQEEDVRAETFINGEKGQAVQALAAEVLTDQHETSQNWLRNGIPVPEPNQDADKAAIDAMTFVKRHRVEQLMKAQDENIRQALEVGEPVEPLLVEKRELEQLRDQINQRAFLQEE